MWSKLFSWSNQKKNNAQAEPIPPTPAEMVQLAIAEIDKNILQNQCSLQETKATQAQIQEKMRAQILELNGLTDQAEKALKKNDELTAKNLMGKKVWLQEQAQQYQHLITQLAQTIQQLEKQIAGLEMRKIEINTKETLLTAQLQKATSQKEMQSYLGELDKTLGFDSFERQIAAIDIENQLASDILAFDEALKNTSPTQNFENIQKQVAQEQQEAQTQKMNNIFGRYFDSQKSSSKEQKNTQDFQTMRKELLNNFFVNKQPEKPTQTQSNEKSQLITDFFAQEKAPEQETVSDKQKQINDFFGK